jgi:two-component system, OmpR family, KDP operon response regulator KdpE
MTMREPVVILVIEDDPQARSLLQSTLTRGGYQCLHADTGAAGVAAAINHRPRLVLLDLGLPDLDGVEVTRKIREYEDTPIIVISARDREADKVAALDEGANDYLTKPFMPGELLARIRVALRMPTQPGQPLGHRLTAGDLAVDFDHRRVTVGEKEVHLTPIEFRLLSLLMRSAGRVLTHRSILRQVWGPPCASQLNYLRVYMKKLRDKIEAEPAQPKYLLSEPGIGYRFRIPD